MTSTFAEAPSEHTGTEPGMRSSPPIPRRSPIRPRRGWLTWLLVMAGAAALAWFSVTEIDRRLDERQQLLIGDVSLTTEPVVIESIDGGTLVSTEVRPQDIVDEGDLLAIMQPPPGSLAGPDPIEVRAPVSGTVLQVARRGSTISGGDAIVSLYRPDELYFQAPLGFADLANVTIGMPAHLEFPSIGTIETTLERVAARLPAIDGQAADTAVVILRPDDPESLRALVPGLVLSGWIDLSAGPADGVPALTSFGTSG